MRHTIPPAAGTTGKILIQHCHISKRWNLIFISARRYLRVYWSIFWRFWIVIGAAGIVFEFINITPPWDLMAERIWSDYDFNQSALEILLKPTLRAVLFAAMFLVLAICRKVSKTILIEKGSPFGAKQWFAIYAIFSAWELFAAALNVLVVTNFSTAMWMLLWNPGLGLFFYLTCLFIAALTFVYINKARIVEKAQNAEKPSVNPPPEWRFEESTSAEGKNRTWNETANPSTYQVPEPDRTSR